MSIVSLLNPINLAEEKQSFFASTTYNPQFVYQSAIDETLLKKWGDPKTEVVALAKKILESRPDLLTQRVPVDKAVLESYGTELFTRIGITEHVEIVFDPNKVTRCSVKGTQVIFRDPPEFDSHDEMEATFNHEVQTHLLRNLNQKKQGWKLDREHHDHQILRTEEGLAVLHSALALQEKLIWRAAAYYLAVSLGMQMDFRQMYNALRSMGFDESFAWRLSIRVKRGLNDCSLPGGNTKDLCYLEGALQMYRWISDPNNDPRSLYIGKVYIEELDEKLKQMTTQDVYFPTFFADIDQYRQQIRHIGDVNFFGEAI